MELNILLKTTRTDIYLPSVGVIYYIHCLIMEHKCTLFVYEKEVMECK